MLTAILLNNKHIVWNMIDAFSRIDIMSENGYYGTQARVYTGGPVLSTRF